MFADITLTTGDFIMIFIAAFAAGFVDSIAGGGGLITLPAYTLTGLPMHFVYGCNKFSAAFGTTVASVRYWKHKMLEVPVGIAAAIGAFVASGIAAKIVLYLDDTTLKTMLLVILPIAGILTVMNKNMGETDNSQQFSTKKKILLGALIGIAMGFYDGIFGPGTGTFAMMAFCFVMKYDLRTASGNAKCLNLASNYAALAVFLIEGTVYFPLAIPAAGFGILGNYIGSGLAIQKGTKFIRVMLMVVMVLLFVSVAIDMM